MGQRLLDRQPRKTRLQSVRMEAYVDARTPPAFIWHMAREGMLLLDCCSASAVSFVFLQEM